MPDQETKSGEFSVPAGTGRPSGRLWIWIAGAVIVAVCAYAWLIRGDGESAHPSGQAANAATRPVPVIAAAAVKGDVGVYLTGLGTVTPLNTVTVRSRVDGQLMAVHFREGEIVEKGRPLAEIDPRPFQAQLTQAEGQLIRDREQLKNAEIDLQRYQTLSQEDSISKQQYDTQKSLVRQLEGAVKIDQGLIENARLQLVYSRITAPLAGRVGLRQVDPGNIIHASDTIGLVVITQLQPIAVIFPIPEDNLPRVMARLGKGERLKVEAFDRDLKEKLAEGYLLTVDNQIDTSTGTVRFKAVFPNSRNELFPNQFVNARLLVEVLHDAVIVPTSAIQRGPRGAFVYVVRRDRTVAMRPVTAGITEEGKTSVTTGLAPGEAVVVDGTEKLRDGSRVEQRTENTSGAKRQGR